MSPELVTGERAPDLDRIEYCCELVERECRNLLAWAREQASARLADVQDATAELEDEWTGPAQLKLARAAYELRSIVRTLERGQLGLVNPDDERYRHVAQRLARNERDDDGPWREAA